VQNRWQVEVLCIACSGPGAGVPRGETRRARDYLRPPRLTRTHRHRHPSRSTLTTFRRSCLCSRIARKMASRGGQYEQTTIKDLKDAYETVSLPSLSCTHATVAIDEHGWSHAVVCGRNSETSSCTSVDRRRNAATGDPVRVPGTKRRRRCHHTVYPWRRCSPPCNSVVHVLVSSRRLPRTTRRN